MSDTDAPWKVGENYFIRTVTFHYTGKLTQVTDQELVLEAASWIPDDGRFADFLKTGVPNEVEPYIKGKQVILGRGAIIDAVTIDWPLPDKQK